MIETPGISIAKRLTGLNSTFEYPGPAQYSPEVKDQIKFAFT